MCITYPPQVGDVIYIEANSGAVKRVGRCDAYATEFDLEAEEYVPLPKGDVHKKKEIVQVGFQQLAKTGHDEDVGNVLQVGSMPASMLTLVCLMNSSMIEYHGAGHLSTAASVAICWLCGSLH